MFGFVSMGVDWGQVSAASAAVRAAADEAALVAAATLSDQPDTDEAIEEAYALANTRADLYTCVGILLKSWELAERMKRLGDRRP